MTLRQRLCALGTLTIAALIATQATGQEAASPASPGQQSIQLQEITVTGSRIPRSEVESAAPITVIKASDIDTQGFRSVFDVLSAITQNTGTVQGEDFGSTFTQAANFINLRGLGPNHTLVLVNGRRIADYPVAYNGSVNATNLANIPSVMIDRIEILSGSASAVYGSDAIAGVVNIILKDRQEGTDLSLKVGGTQEGGGGNQRFQLRTGGSAGNLRGIFGLELSNREPIFFGQRKLSSTYGGYSPPGTVPAPIFGNLDPLTGNYFDPPNGCGGAIGALLKGSIVQVANPDGDGSYCTSDHYYDNRTIQTKKKIATGYGGLTYALGDTAELFGNFMFEVGSIDNTVRSLPWSPSFGPFWNEATGRLEQWTRVMTPEEVGGVSHIYTNFLEHSWTGVLGARGTFGSSDWHYEAAFNRSVNTTDQSFLRYLASVDNFFLGPQIGTHEFDGVAYPVYNADPATHLFVPLTSADIDALTARQRERDRAWTQDWSLTVNGNLFNLPAGPLGVAAVAETGSQGFSNVPDPRTNQGYFYKRPPAMPSRGDRDRYALGIEANVPVFAKLNASLAARYDNYSYGNGGSSKATYNFGLEYRPLEGLLLRGAYGTSFRAPDMNYLFSQQTLGYFPEQTDYYECRLAKKPYSSCGIAYNMNYDQSGNLELQPETAKSFTYGIVWSPNHHFDLTADYYHIVISNEVTDLDVDQILRTEADCLLGQSPSGTPIDKNSTLCQSTLARVQRNPGTAAVNPNQVQNIFINPINAASERTRGIDLSGNLRWQTDHLGEYQLHAAFTRVLQHTFQQFAGDPIQNYLTDPAASQVDWRTRVEANLTWKLDPWNATLDGINYGHIANEALTGFRGPYTVYNGSVGYQLSDRARISFIVENLRNSMPKDTSAGWPNYSIGFYDEYGRQWWLQFDYHFGKFAKRH